MAGQIKYIKVSRIDGNGVDITSTLETLSTIVIPSGSDNVPFQIENATRFEDYYLYYVIPPINFNFSPSITSSVNYNILTTPKNSNSVPAVQYTPMPISLGTINSDSFDFIQSATSSIIPGAGALTYFSPPTDLQNNNQVYIKLQGTASVNGSGGTGLFEFVKGNINDFNAGSGIQVGTNVFINPNASASLDMEVNTTINFGEVIYLRLREGSNNFNVTNLTFSLETFLQITGSSNGIAKQDLPLEPFFTIPFENSDYNVLAGNASQPVTNPFLQDVDYGKGTIIPVNNAALISESATRGTVPESYYTSLAQTNIRYNGSKIQSSDVNVFNPLARGTDFGDPINIGTYGQTPSISLNQSLVAYVDYIKDATPMINGKSIANIKYLINENGDAVSPNLSQITVRDVQNNFEDNKEIDVSLIEPPEGTGMQILNGVKTIIRGGYRVEPILYTQTLSGKIALTSPSTGIPMETSSLTPVLDVRSENTDTATPSYSPNGGVGHIYQFNQENATLPGKAYYSHTTGKYTVNSSVVNSGVTLIFTTQLRGGVGGFNPGPSIGNPGHVRIQIIHDKTANGGGLTVIGDNDGFWDPIYFDNSGAYAGGEENSSLVTGTVASGQYALNDTFYVRINVNFFQQLSFLLPLTTQDPNNPSFQFPYFNVGSIPSPTGIDPITGSIWGISGSSPSSTITSSNTNLLLSYGILKQDFITGSGMDETQQVLTVQPGDEFKFEDNESKTYTVKSVIEPSQDINNNLIVTLDEAISPSAVDLNYFLIRRFAPDGASIIFDELKPGLNPSGPAFIKPKFTTNILDKDIDQFIQNLKSKNLLT